jgi:hypothetical protein
MNPTDELLALNKLLQKGLINEEEFIRLKNDLLLKKKVEYQANLTKKRPNGILFVSICVLLFLASLLAYYFWSERSTNTSVNYSNAKDSSSNSLESTTKSPSYSLPTKLEYSNEQEPNTQAEFYPIGWSDNGKFAYLNMNPASENGKQKLTLYIQDMVTDKIVVKSESTFHNQSPLKNRQTTWSEMQHTFSEILKQHSITQTSIQSISKQPFINDGNRYGFHLYSRKDYELYDFPEFVQATTIHLTVNGNLNKKIFGKKFDDGRYALKIK